MLIHKKTYMGAYCIYKEEALYRTKKGNYYLVCKNGALTVIAEWYLMSDKPEKIYIPISEKEACDWTEYVMNKNLYQVIAEKCRFLSTQ